MTDAVTAAAEVVADLEARREAAVKRKTALAEERRRVAYGAHTGVKAAENRLADINQEAADLVTELETFDAAIAEAKRRHVAAELEAAAEERRAKARQARECVAELRRRGAELTTALTTFVDSFQAFQGLAHRVSSLGIRGPSLDVIRVGIDRALQSALRGTRLEARYVRIGHRATIDALTASWTAEFEGQIARALGEAAPADVSGERSAPDGDGEGDLAAPGAAAPDHLEGRTIQ